MGLRKPTLAHPMEDVLHGSEFGGSTSALGHKRTSARVLGMSALSPKADMRAPIASCAQMLTPITERACACSTNAAKTLAGAPVSHRSGHAHAIFNQIQHSSSHRPLNPRCKLPTRVLTARSIAGTPGIAHHVPPPLICGGVLKHAVGAAPAGRLRLRFGSPHLLLVRRSAAVCTN
jgi:hypothetical protein